MQKKRIGTYIKGVIVFNWLIGTPRQISYTRVADIQIFANRLILFFYQLITIFICQHCDGVAYILSTLIRTENYWNPLYMQPKTAKKVCKWYTLKNGANYVWPILYCLGSWTPWRRLFSNTKLNNECSICTTIIDKLYWFVVAGTINAPSQHKWLEAKFLFVSNE